MMTKLILIILAAIGFGFVVSPEIDSSDVIEKAEVTNHDEALPALDLLIESNSESKEYEAYLEVLNGSGPKETDFSTKAEPSDAVVTEKVDNTFDKPLKEASKEPSTKAKSTFESELNDSNSMSKGKEEKLVMAPSHVEFGKLLKKHVNAQGNVDYAGFKADLPQLNAYLKILENNPADNSWSKNERLAYYINVYNAFTIKLILDNYPVKSIQDINGGKPWDKLFIKLGSTSYTLNDIENNIIRPQFREPRIHFAVNCAAASCPPLLNDAYYPETLMAQLNERTKSFINNKSYNNISSSKLELSKIFDWYGSDFGDVKDFIGRYVDTKVKSATVTFKEYNWALNKQ